jgi:anaerobic selenocysteine-containing dehydrogenase/Fe-S-cluster-containing hydrogenase component 2
MKKQKQYGMLIDLDRCVGCYACQVACKSEHNVPFGIFRCRVETYQSGRYPDIRKLFLPRLCNHCENAPCIDACKEKALFKNSDGIVLFRNNACIGCLKCAEKCPYKAIDINSETGQAEKCDFCSHRIEAGSLPVCAESCMGKAITFGDINDNKSKISALLRKNMALALNPEFRTNPSVFYIFKGKTAGAPLSKYRKYKTIPSHITSAEKKSPVSKKAKLINTSDVMCPAECGISVLVEKGVATHIYGNPHSLVNNGTLCAKGASGLQLTYSPHRIKTPLIRTGARGEEKWKAVTWTEAADHISKKLIQIKRRFGPEAVFLDTGDVTDREAYYRLFHAFGTPNTYNHGSICDTNRKWGPGIMTGDERPLPDIQRPFLIRNNKGKIYLKKNHDARLILNIGANPFVATRFNYMSYGIPAARKENKCIYIVIDPAFTNSAAHADIWLPIKPGTDTALLAAMLNYIIKNDSPAIGYIDHNFVEKYTLGWQQFKKTFLSYTENRDTANNLKYFSLEWAEEKTGISCRDIEKISHLFGITKPASIEIGMHGTAHHTNGDVTSILMTALCLITGNIDNPGGLVFIDSQKVKKGTRTIGREFIGKIVERKVNGKTQGGRLADLNKDAYGDYPAAWKGVLADLPQKIREGVKLKHGPFKNYHYPVKALVVRGGNPVITAGSTPDWIDALTAKDKNPPSPPVDKGGMWGFSEKYLLELIVFIDTHITETGKYADIILPEAGFLERMGLSDVYTMSPEVAIREQAIKPLHMSKTPFEIMISLSEALSKNGDTDVKPQDFRKRYKNEEAFINELLIDAPGFYNIGTPLPYPDIPEGALIAGTPDNPTALIEGKIIKRGKPVNVQWLRNHHGVAVWPASYYRYKKSDGSSSGIYPRTESKKFEFRFSYLEKFNREFRTNYPLTFYWKECKWNPKNPSYKNISIKYPFQLITGRVHHAMTMTKICPYLAETETECMKQLNSDFKYTMPKLESIPNKYSLPDDKEVTFRKNTVSIPVLAFNRADAKRLGIKTGDTVTLENPLKKKIKGKAFLTEEIMPGVIKTAFGPGGQKSSGSGFIKATSGYTPNVNELVDPLNISGYTGMPGYGDILVKVNKAE